MDELDEAVQVFGRDLELVSRSEWFENLYHLLLRSAGQSSTHND